MKKQRIVEIYTTDNGTERYPLIRQTFHALLVKGSMEDRWILKAKVGYKIIK